MTAPRRILPRCESPRFRLVRMWRVQGRIKAEIIGSAEHPEHAITSVFAEPDRVLAVDRNGYPYSDNHKPISERTAP